MHKGIRRHTAAARLALCAVATTCCGDLGQAVEAPGQAHRIEILRFADTTVRVVRGPAGPVETAPATLRPPRRTIERITFSGAVPTGVTIVRGTGMASAPVALAPPVPANALDFERIAHAVHGAESSHGADLRMWRPDPDGPQGPMQVSEAAARDTGGGNRFDTAENLLLGRAYLARMFRRYGNWPDALAAYNWGPGNLDRWIAAGRDAGRMPRETARYIDRVLRDARMTGIAGDTRPPITR
jgi:hypothetical protein